MYTAAYAQASHIPNTPYSLCYVRTSFPFPVSVRPRRRARQGFKTFTRARYETKRFPKTRDRYTADYNHVEIRIYIIIYVIVCTRCTQYTQYVRYYKAYPFVIHAVLLYYISCSALRIVYGTPC